MKKVKLFFKIFLITLSIFCFSFIFGVVKSNNLSNTENKKINNYNQVNSIDYKLNFISLVSQVKKQDNSINENDIHVAKINQRDSVVQKDVAVKDFSNPEIVFTLVKDVIIPIPTEIFDILDKLDNPIWNNYFLENDYKKTRDRNQIALLLGVVVAEGFLAVQSENSKKIEELGNEVLNISRTLGLENSVKEHCHIILDAVKTKKWSIIRIEFDKVQRSVENAMNELGDNGLAQLASTGGWLRGLDIALNIVSNNYSKDKAELLNQDQVAKHFYDTLKNLDRTQYKSKLIDHTQFTLNKLITHLNKRENVLNINDIKEIKLFCSELINEIIKGKEKSKLFNDA